MTNTPETKRSSRSGRLVLVVVALLLAAFGLWKVIDYRKKPLAPVVSSPEEGDALRYLAEAKNSANAAGEDPEIDEILRAIASTQAQAGDFVAAKATAKSVKDEGAKSFALIDVAAAQAEMGDLTGAQATVKSFPAGADEFVDEGFAVAAKTQAQQGHIASAKATANLIKDPPSRARAESEIARIQARAGDVAGASATANAITEDAPKASAVAEIGAAQAKAGDKAAAAQSLTQAEALANAIQDDEEKSWVLRDLAIAQAKAGDVSKAKSTVGGTIPMDGSAAWRGIAKAQVTAGDIAGARATINAIAENRDKAQALTDVALAQARSGDKAGAVQTFAEAKAFVGPPDEHRGRDWGDIAAAQARAGDIIAAQATIGSVTEERFKAKAYCAIAVAQVEAGDLAGAKGTLNTAIEKRADDGQKLFPGLRAIVAAQVRAEGLPATAEWVQNLSEPRTRALYFIALAKARLNPDGVQRGDENELERDISN